MMYTFWNLLLGHALYLKTCANMRFRLAFVNVYDDDDAILMDFVGVVQRNVMLVVLLAPL